MPITKDHIFGVAVGVGVAAAGYYLYKKNQDKIDEILRAHGMDIPVNENKPLEKMSIEELATFKEQIEDMIAERELSAFGFLRCNKCYLINPKFVVAIKGSEVRVGNRDLQISRPRRATFLAELAAWCAGQGGGNDS